MSTQNCRIGKIRFYVNGQEFWADDIAKVHATKRALDVNYGVKVTKPKHSFTMPPLLIEKMNKVISDYAHFLSTP